MRYHHPSEFLWIQIMIRSIVTQWNFVTCQSQEIKYSSLNIPWTIKKKHNLLSLSFLFYERNLNTNLSFISGDLPFQGNYLIAITHTHTSSNVTVTNINKKKQNMLWACFLKNTNLILFQALFSFQGITNQTMFHFRTLLWHHFLH